MSAPQEGLPAAGPQESLVTSLDVHIYYRGDGLTRATVHWTQGTNGDRRARRTRVLEVWWPRPMRGAEDGYEALLQVLTALEVRAREARRRNGA